MSKFEFNKRRILTYFHERIEQDVIIVQNNLVAVLLSVLLVWLEQPEVEQCGQQVEDHLAHPGRADHLIEGDVVQSLPVSVYICAKYWMLWDCEGRKKRNFYLNANYCLSGKYLDFSINNNSRVLCFNKKSPYSWYFHIYFHTFHVIYFHTISSKIAYDVTTRHPLSDDKVRTKIEIKFPG